MEKEKRLVVARRQEYGGSANAQVKHKDVPFNYPTVVRAMTVMVVNMQT
jgi:hypothetical protein